MFDVLRKQLPIKQAEVEDWLALDAEQRRPWFDKADLRTSAALLLLEQASLRRQLLLAQDEVKQRYLNAAALKDGSINKADETLKQMLANSGFLSRPAELLDAKGYGLPQPDERAHLEQVSAERQAAFAPEYRPGQRGEGAAGAVAGQGDRGGRGQCEAHW